MLDADGHASALQRLSAFVDRGFTNVDEAIGVVLDLAKETLGLRSATLVRGDDGGAAPHVVPDALVNVPITLRDGTTYGLLSAIDSQRRTLDDDELAFLRILARFLANELDHAHSLVGLGAVQQALAGQNRVLRHLAAGAPLTDVLVELCQALEEQLGGGYASVLLAESGALTWGAAPNLPASYVATLPFVPIGPDIAVCGRAAYSRQPVIVTDIATDPRVVDYRDAALAHGLRACWSVPILDEGDGSLLGTFAVYDGIPRAPTEDELAIVTEAGRIAGTAIRARRLEEALARSETWFRSVLEHASDLVTIIDADLIRRYASPSCERLLGYAPEEFVGVDATSISHPDDSERAHRFYQELAKRPGAVDKIALRAVHRDGSIHWMEIIATNRLDTPGIEGFVVIARDVTERMLAEEALRRSEAEFRLVFASNPHPMWVYDRETLAFLEVNDAAAAHYGYTRDEFLALKLTDIRPEEEIPALLRFVTGNRPPTQRASFVHRVKDGGLIDVEITSHTIDFRGRPAALVVAQDVTARKALEDQLAHQAFHDVLTGLPNRVLFLDRLERALERAGRQGTAVGVLFIDLDDFKYVNDTLGHKAGDKLLLAVGDRLRVCLRSGDTVARLGGDEFTFVIEDLGGRADAVEAAERIIETLREPFTVEGRQVFITPSIGVALGSSDADRPEELLRLADVAMYEAKHKGKARFAVFDRSMDDQVWRRLELETELRRAVAEERLRVYYQPVVALETGRIVEVEALARWQHPTRGIVYPSEFIPLAEETGLIVALGQQVLTEACRQVRVWQEELGFDPPLTVAINLSARQFQHPDLVAQVAGALRQARLDPACLMLELTETAAMVDVASESAVLRDLKRLGVGIAIDDFGTGYSGLAYLQRCPVDALKIDRSYVVGLGTKSGEMAMIRAVMAFAQTLGLNVTAEGIETAEQFAELRALGCDQGQGFYFAEPLPPDQARALLASGRRWRPPIPAAKNDNNPATAAD